MKVFLDTSVLVATFYAEHEHHEPSLALFLQQKKLVSFTAAHCMAEFYAVVTGMPGNRRANPDEALLFLGDVRERLSTVALNDDEYFRALKEAAAAGISGGTLYDAIIGHCALKANAQAIYTWNLKHYSRLGERIPTRVRSPV